MAWIEFPYADVACVYTLASLKNRARLHAGDAEPFPNQPALAETWNTFPARVREGGQTRLTPAIEGHAGTGKTDCIHATNLEKSDSKKSASYREVAKRCKQQQAEQLKIPPVLLACLCAGPPRPRHSNTVGPPAKHRRPSQSKSGPNIGSGAQACRRPYRIDTCHAEILDKVGAMLVGMT